MMISYVDSFTINTMYTVTIVNDEYLVYYKLVYNKIEL